MADTIFIMDEGFSSLDYDPTRMSSADEQEEPSKTKQFIEKYGSGIGNALGGILGGFFGKSTPTATTTQAPAPVKEEADNKKTIIIAVTVVTVVIIGLFVWKKYSKK